MLCGINCFAIEQYGELFDKIDVTKEGVVDWDKFASHMLLEFYELDDRVKSTQIPRWRDLRVLKRLEAGHAASSRMSFKTWTDWA